jgi:hypothetical protein
MLLLALDCCLAGHLFEMGREVIVRFQSKDNILPNLDVSLASSLSLFSTIYDLLRGKSL